MKSFAVLILVALLIVGCAATPAGTTSGGTAGRAAESRPSAHYHLVRHITVGGTGGWDYLTVDSASRRLFLSHSDRVEVVDLSTGRVTGTITNTPGVHGIALAPALHRGFVSVGRSSSVTIFDLDSLATLREVKTTGERPDAILFEPVTARVFTFNAGSRNATAIDAATGDVVGTIDLGGQPEFARPDGRGRVFVNIEDTAEVVSFDAKTLQVAARWKLDGCEAPTGLAIDQTHRRLYSACSNKVMAVSDADAARTITTVPIGEGADGAEVDATFGVAFSPNGSDGTLTVIDVSTPARSRVIETVPTQKGARTMTLDEKTHHLFLATAQYGPPPAPTAERPHPRASIVPGSFEVIEMAR